MAFSSMKLSKGFKQFLLKTGIFVLLFILFSALIGINLYSAKLLYEFGIYIYGRVGYILLFSIAGFILLYRNKLLSLERQKYRLKDFLFLLLSFALLGGFYFLEINISKIESTIPNMILTHLLGVSIFIFLFLGIYGLNFTGSFLKKFRKEVLYFVIFGIITGSLMDIVWSSWPYLSFLVLKINSFIFDILNINYQIIQPDIIRVGSFAAKIGEACSGVYSIFLFTALYLFIVFVDWKRINKKKAASLFLPAVMGAFLINVLRVMALLLIGGFVSKEVAMGLYHSYSGMIFFLIYFTMFWVFFYKWIKNEKATLFKLFQKDSLYKNSMFLMASTLIMASFGFVFWMISARLFSAEQIGLATTIISITTLITSFSLVGLNTGIIRYLPSSERKNDKINTCFTIVVILTIIITAIFLLGINKFSPKLIFIRKNILFSLAFIFFMVFSSLGSLIDSIFIAYRNAKFVFLENSIFSILKIISLFFFVSLGAYGIFSSWMIALVLGTIMSVFILIFKFNYKPKIVFYDSIIKKIGRYSFGNYIAGFLGGIPTFLLPIIITNSLHPEITAYYYIAMMIATLLFAIPQSTANSLFAEGSYSGSDLKGQIKKSIRMISLLMVPAIILMILLGKYVLLMFGKNYSSEGFAFLNLLALSGIFISINSLFSAFFKVKRKIKQLVAISCIAGISILGLSYFFIIRGFGLLGIGYAWLVGQALSSMAYFMFLGRGRKGGPSESDRALLGLWG